MIITLRAEKCFKNNTDSAINIHLAALMCCSASRWQEEEKSARDVAIESGKNDKTGAATLRVELIPLR